MIHLEADQKTRVRTILLSIAVGTLILALKTVAYLISGSAALKSDAIESIVNVVAAVFALGAVLFAGKPADEDHPYGHGKIEHFSAVFEGGLISFAAFFIVYESIKSIIFGSELHDLSLGVALNFVAGGMNGLLGWYMVRSGRKFRSRALEADGHHILSDFYTTLGIGAGLIVVKLTGLAWLDSVLALGVGVLLAFTGFHLVKESSVALLDSEDPELVGKILGAIKKVRTPDIIAVHGLRTLRAGRYMHVDLHIVVPEFRPVSEAHDEVDELERAVLQDLKEEGEFHSHMDPCMRAYCRHCAVQDCPVRQAPFETLNDLSRQEAILPDAKVNV